jgi:hypothetical protein
LVLQVIKDIQELLVKVVVAVLVGLDLLVDNLPVVMEVLELYGLILETTTQVAVVDQILAQDH